MELKGSVWHRRSEGVLRPPRPRPSGCGEAGPGTPSHPGPSPPLPVRPVPGFQVSAPARQAALHLRGIARDSALWIFRSSASQIRCPEPVQTWSVGPRPAGPCGSRSRRTSSRSPESAIQPGPPFSSDTRSLRPLRPTDLSDPVSLAKPLARACTAGATRLPEAAPRRRPPTGGAAARGRRRWARGFSWRPGQPQDPRRKIAGAQPALPEEGGQSGHAPTPLIVRRKIWGWHGHPAATRLASRMAWLQR
ncbi:uncharacterized protein [Chlorocebus sabaeus]|uniref:uncharacterized protein n=1 Tax=Chlorocebus sabaeus TaxID=60711 RepID=UPI003BF9A827